MESLWYKKNVSENTRLKITQPLPFLLRKIQDRPRVINLLKYFLNRFPITFSYQNTKLKPLFLNWKYSDEIFELREQIETSTLLFLNTNVKPDFIFDFGASCGISTHILFAQNPKAKVFAYEPRPSVFPRLQQRMEKMAGSHECHQTAVGLHTEQVEFKDRGVGTSRANPDEKSFSVRMVTLDQKMIFDRDAKLVLKMDIEGEEKNLLPFIVPLLPESSVILLETHQPFDQVKEFAKSSLEAGFQWKLLRYREMPEYGGPFADWIVTGPTVRFET